MELNSRYSMLQAGNSNMKHLQENQFDYRLKIHLSNPWHFSEATSVQETRSRGFVEDEVARGAIKLLIPKGGLEE